MKDKKQKRKNFFSQRLFLQKNCKGELTTQQIVMLIILITSFAVILFLLFRLNLGEVTDKEICHNSVVMKGKSIVGGSLDCKTNYVCISGGGECKDFNPTITIKVNSDNKSQIMKAIVEEMVDCWWMFGEGKVSYLDLTDLTGAHCAICSILKFDEKIQDNLDINEISYEELYYYLLNNQKDDSEKYFTYFYSDFKDIHDWNSFMEGFNFDVSNIDISQKYAVVTGINKGEIYNTGKAYLPVYFVKSDEITSKTICNVFDITKA